MGFKTGSVMLAVASEEQGLVGHGPTAGIQTCNHCAEPHRQAIGGWPFKVKLAGLDAHSWTKPSSNT